MNRHYEAALEFQRFFQERGWRFCVIGGVAIMRWGELRTTQDVDLSLLTGFGEEEKFIDALLARFASRRENAAEFALRHRVLTLRASNGLDVDIALAALPYEEEMIGRATPFDYESDVSLVTCSAEDLVVLKAFAARPQDWRDVEGILIRQGERLDWGYIRTHLPPLCELKEAPEIMDRLNELRRSTAV